jgi:hypothetical protein
VSGEISPTHNGRTSLRWLWRENPWLDRRQVRRLRRRIAQRQRAGDEAAHRHEREATADILERRAAATAARRTLDELGVGS